MNLKEEVEKGLSAPQKAIPSRFFYDTQGDKIFQAIMRLPEYYLTKSEYEVFATQTPEILKKLNLDKKPFDLIEFGAGDGFKTKILIQNLIKEKTNFKYIPIDISNDVLQTLQSAFLKKFPDLEMVPYNGEYFDALQKIGVESKNPKVVLFLGSSIGNFNQDRTNRFLKSLYQFLNKDDHVIIGFDLKKNPYTILKAYNDSQGVTRAFNMNLLMRINRELDADFNLENFEHYPTYDPITGFAKSFLVSTIKQTVTIKAIGKSFDFEAGETIHTELSRKFTVDQINSLFENFSFEILDHFFDCKHYYSVALAKRV